MRRTFILFGLFICTHVVAQGIKKIKVLDNSNHKTIAFANIEYSGSLLFADTSGTFSLKLQNGKTSARVVAIGYTPLIIHFIINTNKDIDTIWLIPKPFALNEVSITATRNYKADSIKKREEYAKVFNYQPPKLKDIFVNKSLFDDGNQFPPNIFATNNTAQLIGINVLQLINVLGKKKDPTYKLQKELIADEQATYVDHVFSKSLVAYLTGFKSDSLQLFMDKYRPTFQQANTLNNYDMILYIKKSAGKFRGY